MFASSITKSTYQTTKDTKRFSVLFVFCYVPFVIYSQITPLNLSAFCGDLAGRGKSVTAASFLLASLPCNQSICRWHARCEMRWQVRSPERKINHEKSRFINAGGGHVVRCRDLRITVSHRQCQRPARSELPAPSSSSSSPAPASSPEPFELLMVQGICKYRKRNLIRGSGVTAPTPTRMCYSRDQNPISRRLPWMDFSLIRLAAVLR